MKDVEIKIPETRDIPRKPAAVADIFPRRQKSKLIRPKPNLWEVTKEETKNLKNTLLKEKSDGMFDKRTPQRAMLLPALLFCMIRTCPYCTVQS